MDDYTVKKDIFRYYLWTNFIHGKSVTKKIYIIIFEGVYLFLGYTMSIFVINNTYDDNTFYQYLLLNIVI